ncbi:porin [Paraburkholderia dipogonis]|uniref:Porin n=1 Tax=Paraburkholderia dipogonis TaxID=1211383 RepID=A0A4Y8MHK8_9BURK|nr:porin [Paraburkholderia dipogonis]TFE36874.1 porin [Paraburkholderia dipogonis]
MKKRALAVAAVAALTANASWAQNSVTLYGTADIGMSYQNNVTPIGSGAAGKSRVQMFNGVYGSRFGLKGAEDLGAGNKIVFTLESGFGLTNGAQQYTNAMFGRQAFVGVTNPAYGTLTLGRQYLPYQQLLAPYAPTYWLPGYNGAHPGDIDAFDTGYRINNSVVYYSPSYHGLSFGGSYAFGGVAGSVDQGSTWSGAVQYLNGPFGIAAGLVRINNSAPGGGAWGAASTANSGGQEGISAINYGFSNAQAQQRIGVTGGWQFTKTLDISFSYSNVQYIPGVNSGFHSEAIWNTIGTVLHWKATPALDISGGYSYTAATKSNGITDPASYNQFSLFQAYSLSKRSVLYAAQGYQHASGKTLTLAPNGLTSVVNATPSVGDGFNSTPSSTSNQFIFAVGYIQRF